MSLKQSHCKWELFWKLSYKHMSIVGFQKFPSDIFMTMIKIDFSNLYLIFQQIYNSLTIAMRSQV